MAKRAENEGFRVLDDFVCDAILQPGIPQADPRKQGKNEGVRVIGELVFGGEGDGKERDHAQDKELPETGFSGESRLRLLHCKEPSKDSLRQRLDWERLKDLSNEGSLSRGALEELCLAVRDRELAFWVSSGLRESGRS